MGFKGERLGGCGRQFCFRQGEINGGVAERLGEGWFGITGGSVGKGFGDTCVGSFLSEATRGKFLRGGDNLERPRVLRLNIFWHQRKNRD